MKNVFFVVLGTLTALASMFFTYYSVRLVYVNLFFDDAAAHRSDGMFIGMIVFPVAMIGFALVSLLSFRSIRKRK